MLKVTEETGYPIISQYGQRIVGPHPLFNDPEPERGSELYCYMIPSDCFEVRNKEGSWLRPFCRK